MRRVAKMCVAGVIAVCAACGWAENCWATNQLPDEEVKSFSQNNILFYDPYDCRLGGRGAGMLAGDTIEEKIWNYFVSAGIPGVSDSPEVIAGIMGNFYTESGYNPFMRGSNGKYRALWMLMDSYNGKRYALDLAVEVNSAVGGNYWKFYGWWGSPTDADNKLASEGVPQSAIDTAIQVELDYLTKSDKYAGDWNSFVGKLDWVANKTPSGYSDLFLVTIERAVGGSSPITDPGVSAHYSGLYQGAAKRRQAAEDAYERLTSAATVATSSSTAAATSSDNSSTDSETTVGAESSTPSSISTSDAGSSWIDATTITSEITLVGDSISVFSESELMQKFPNSFLNKVGSRHSTSKGACDGDEGGLDVLKKIVNGSGMVKNQHQGQTTCETVTLGSSALKENVVWALGTNTIGANENTLQSVLELVGSRKLFLVTPFNNSSRYLPEARKTVKEYTDEIAEMYRNFANAHDNVYIVDWNKEVRDNVSTYILSDNVHPTSEGTKLFAKLIYEAVSGSKSCTTYSGDYPQYLQCDPKWKDTKYGGSDMCNAGCGPASLAMLVTVATGKDVSPVDIAAMTEDPPYFEDKVGGEWKRKAHTIKVCEKYGCEAKEIPNTEEAIRQALKEGWMIHLSGGSNGSAETTAFPTENGHYVGIFSIDSDDNVMIADSAGNAHREKKNRFNRKMSLSNAIKDRWKDDRPVMAIRGTNGNTGKNSCELAGSYCTDGGGSSLGAINGGLSKEQAQKIIDMYKSSGVTVAKYSLPAGTKCNCTSLSAFFVQEFTTAGLASTGGWLKYNSGRWGDGIDTIEYLHRNLGVEVGTEPRPFAIFSTDHPKLASHYCGSYKCGHTGIVVAVEGDNLITIEASYGNCSFTGVKTNRPKSYFTNSKYSYTYAYLDSILDTSKLSGVVGGL